jgi:hypothetical protein
MDTPWECAVVRVQGERVGTGVAVDRDARLLLSCVHVLGGSRQVRVRFPGHDTTLTANVVENWAPDLDAALLQVPRLLLRRRRGTEPHRRRDAGHLKKVTGLR